MQKLTFIGAGSMAEAVLAGILKQGILTTDQIHVTNKNNIDRLARIREKYDVVCTNDKQEAVEGASIVILATKPYDLEEAAASINPYLQPEQLIVSVIAGISTAYISKLLGEGLPVVRTMPNTSAAVGQSATAICAGRHATADDVEKVEALFQTIGSTTVVSEADMHTVTGISGSGPAYVYYLVEAMEQAAAEAGLDKDTADRLITQTIVGAGEMLQTSGKSASELREAITSPGGTTEAGIQTLVDHGFQQMMRTGVHRARHRSEELGGE